MSGRLEATSSSSGGYWSDLWAGRMPTGPARLEPRIREMRLWPFQPTCEDLRSLARGARAAGSSHERRTRSSSMLTPTTRTATGTSRGGSSSGCTSGGPRGAGGRERARSGRGGEVAQASRSRSQISSRLPPPFLLLLIFSRLLFTIVFWKGIGRHSLGRELRAETVHAWFRVGVEAHLFRRPVSHRQSCAAAGFADTWRQAWRERPIFKAIKRTDARVVRDLRDLQSCAADAQELLLQPRLRQF